MSKPRSLLVGLVGLVGTGGLASFLGLAGCSSGSQNSIPAAGQDAGPTPVYLDGGGNAEGGEGPVDASLDSPTTTIGPVSIKNLSVSMATSMSAEITFALSNTGTSRIERWQQITLSVGGTPVRFAPACTPPDAQILSGSTSNIITLKLDTSTHSNDLLSSACEKFLTGDGRTQPWGNELTLDLKGVLTDATPWKATSSATR